MIGSLIEHEVGVYIGLLLLACLVGVLAKWITHVPYTIALTLTGLAIGLLSWGPEITETGFSKELIFFVVLPPLLFQGALHIELNRLFANFWPILIFAVFGVFVSTFVIGGIMSWIGGINSLLVALLFGALITPTDPVSVLAIFKQLKIPKDLRYLVEGESLFNDGTGVVIFGIILELITGEAEFKVTNAIWEFFKVGISGGFLGMILGGFVFFVMKRLDDHLLENALCLVLAYGSFWVAEVFHLSGVIAVVVAGLLIGNFGRRLSMSSKTTETVETFFETIDFLINSILFILIGLELQTITGADLTSNLRPLAVALAAFLIGRAVGVYPMYFGTNLVGKVRPAAWSHVLFWGGLRGSIPIALLVGLPHHPAIDPYRNVLLVAVFGVVFFSLVIQGLTFKPLLKWLHIDHSIATEGTVENPDGII